MFLYLVQHGEAKSEEEDPDRRLTDRGITAVNRVAEHAGRAGITVHGLFHSAKPRAQQTARIIAEQLKPEKGIDQSDNLLPMDDPALWALRIEGMNEDVMLVGHLPHLAKLSGLLLCGDSNRICVDFKMGGIVCLRRFDDGRWTVAWALPPEIV